MQDQATESGDTSPASAIGSFLVTLIVHGASHAVDGLFHAIRDILPGHSVALKKLETIGPLPADDERAHLPTLPAFQPPPAEPPATVTIPPDALAPVAILDQEPTFGEFESIIIQFRAAVAAMLAMEKRCAPDAREILKQVYADVESQIKADAVAPVVAWIESARALLEGDRSTVASDPADADAPPATVDDSPPSIDPGAARPR